MKFHTSVFIVCLFTSITYSSQETEYGFFDNRKEQLVDLKIRETEGPVLLSSNLDKLISSQCESLNRSGITISKKSACWKNGEIPYVYEPANHPYKKDIDRAMNTFNQETKIKFIPRDKNKHKDFVAFTHNLKTSSGKCYSEWIGRKKERQVVNIGACRKPIKASIMHELGHAIGMWHEHQRPDRDLHIEVFEFDMASSDVRNAYKKFDKSTWNKKGGKHEGGKEIATPYDINSIMHYYPKQGALKNSVVFESKKVKNPTFGNLIGKLSKGDIKSINKLATCSVSDSDNPYPMKGKNKNSKKRGNAKGASSLSPTGNKEKFERRYDVDLISKNTDLSSWAASAAMIVGWRDKVSVDSKEITGKVDYWRNYYDKDNGKLNADKVDAFEYWGLTPAGALPYTPAQLRQFLEYGPLWVGTNGEGKNAIVISGISGDGTTEGTIIHFNNPDNRNAAGKKYSESFSSFYKKMTGLTNTEKTNSKELNDAYFIAY